MDFFTYPFAFVGLCVTVGGMLIAAIIILLVRPEKSRASRATFDSDTFENDYILAILEHYKFDLTTAGQHGAREAQITDKYAVELTAFMNGQIVQAVKKS